MSAIRLQDLQRDVLGSLKRVENGETLVVTRDDEPVAEIKPVHVPSVARGKRPYGLARGEFQVSAAFDAPLPDEVLREFEGR